MQIEKLTQSYLVSILEEEKIPMVSNALQLLREGKEPTPRSPLFKDEGESTVFDNYLKILSRTAGITSDLYDYEVSRMSKVGPQGGYPPFDDRKRSFEDYYSLPGRINYTDDEIEDLATRVRDHLFRGKKDLRPWSYERVIRKGQISGSLDTNSGCPSYGKRSDTTIQARAIRDARSGKWKSYPAILGSRGQRKADRFIFMFPFSTNLIEQSFVNCVLDAIRSNSIPSFSAWEGFDSVALTITQQGVSSTKTKCSTDYVKMDKHFGPDHFDFVFRVLAPLFQPSVREQLRESLTHCSEIPVLVSTDKLYTGTHGMPSGSGWTNLAESIVSLAIMMTVEDYYGEDAAKQVLGDDGVMLWKSEITDFPDVFSEHSQKFGMVSSPDKQRVDAKTFTYLQRFFDVRIRTQLNGKLVVAGSYPGVLALNSAMNPERFHDPVKWRNSMESLRWIMILENVNQSPVFHNLIDYFIKGDKFKLGLTIPGFLKRGITQAYQTAKTLKDFIPTYTKSSTERGILDFEVVKYLRMKRLR
jgi:hypothetical protein